ncbi:hypothetical protein [Raineyella sp. W15-4]|uniref:hypothetical protein n=1 Tax=Raineyella sp. W15-4 TaxID=3081651 RepID=UPI0029539198|nr:hypothetical protein [Raineyella sp. W15-4]WOQ17442.1 hypothetical protein R0145_01615 [Raineyella sp. W15-4]
MPRPAPAALLLALALPLAGCATGSHSLLATPSPQTPPPATMVHLADVRTGMCLDADRLPGTGRVAYLEVLGCAVDHTAEVVAVLDGNDPAARGDAPCSDAFQAYVGSVPDHSDTAVRVLTASADAWDRSGPAPTVCLAVSPTPVTGSVRGTGR